MRISQCQAAGVAAPENDKPCRPAGVRGDLYRGQHRSHQCLLARLSQRLSHESAASLSHATRDFFLVYTTPACSTPLPFSRLIWWWPFASPTTFSATSIAESSDVNFSRPPPLLAGATVSATTGDASFLVVLPGAVLWPAVVLVVRVMPERAGAVLVPAAGPVVFFTVWVTLVPKPMPPVLVLLAGFDASEAEIFELTASLAVLVPAGRAGELPLVRVVAVRLVAVEGRLVVVAVEGRLVAVKAGRVLSVLGRDGLGAAGLDGEVGVFFTGVVRVVVGAGLGLGVVLVADEGVVLAAADVGVVLAVADVDVGLVGDVRWLSGVRGVVLAAAGLGGVDDVAVLGVDNGFAEPREVLVEVVVDDLADMAVVGRAVRLVEVVPGLVVGAVLGRVVVVFAAAGLVAGLVACSFPGALADAFAAGREAAAGVFFRCSFTVFFAAGAFLSATLVTSFFSVFLSSFLSAAIPAAAATAATPAAAAAAAPATASAAASAGSSFVSGSL